MFLYASSPPFFLFGVVSQERKSTVFMNKYKWPSKDARGPADHF